MPVASSMGELEQMLRHQLQSAMQVVQAKAEADMFEEVGSFYSGGSPKNMRGDDILPYKYICLRMVFHHTSTLGLLKY